MDKERNLGVIQQISLVSAVSSHPLVQAFAREAAAMELLRENAIRELCSFGLERAAAAEQVEAAIAAGQLAGRQSTQPTRDCMVEAVQLVLREAKKSTMPQIATQSGLQGTFGGPAIPEAPR